MKMTMKNGTEAEIELMRDQYGLPSLVANGVFIASLSPDGRLMLFWTNENLGGLGLQVTDEDVTVTVKEFEDYATA